MPALRAVAGFHFVLKPIHRYTIGARGYRRANDIYRGPVRISARADIGARNDISGPARRSDIGAWTNIYRGPARISAHAGLGARTDICWGPARISARAPISLRISAIIARADIAQPKYRGARTNVSGGPTRISGREFRVSEGGAHFWGAACPEACKREGNLKVRGCRLSQLPWEARTVCLNMADGPQKNTILLSRRTVKVWPPGRFWFERSCNSGRHTLVLNANPLQVCVVILLNMFFHFLLSNRGSPLKAQTKGYLKMTDSFTILNPLRRVGLTLAPREGR